MGKLHRVRWLAFGALALLALALAPPALAQETREYELPDLDEPPTFADYFRVRFTAANRFVGSANFGSLDAVSYQPEARLRIQFPVSQNALLRLDGRGRVLIYDFSGEHDLDGGGTTDEAPFDDLNSWSGRILGGYVLPETWTLFSETERWGLVAQATVKSNYEAGAKVSSGLRAQGGIAAFYRLGETLEIALGVQVGWRNWRNNVGVAPIFEFDWQMTEHWRLRSYGLGLQIERSLPWDLTVFTRARLEGSSYRLAKREGPASGGQMQVRQIPAALGLRWSRWRHLRVTLLGGVMAYNRLKVKDENRNTLGQVKASNVSPYFTVRFDIR